MRRLAQLARWGVLGLIGAALYDQLSRPPEARTWYGRVGGLVPYDFRPLTVERLRARLWNCEDERLFVPHAWGVGWTVNFCQLWRRVQPIVNTFQERVQPRRVLSV